MLRADAVRQVVEALPDDHLLVACNGMIGREVFTARDRESTFYMIGSMGLALSIGLGVAQCRPDRQVVVLDGDGNVLMGAGVLATAAALAPENLHHVVLDNEAHGSTGDQRTVSDVVPLEAMAKAAGYVSAERVDAEGATPHQGPGAELGDQASTLVQRIGNRLRHRQLLAARGESVEGA